MRGRISRKLRPYFGASRVPSTPLFEQLDEHTNTTTNGSFGLSRRGWLGQIEARKVFRLALRCVVKQSVIIVLSLHFLAVRSHHVLHCLCFSPPTLFSDEIFASDHNSHQQHRGGVPKLTTLCSLSLTLPQLSNHHQQLRRCFLTKTQHQP